MLRAARRSTRSLSRGVSLRCRPSRMRVAPRSAPVRQFSEQAQSMPAAVTLSQLVEKPNDREQCLSSGAVYILGRVAVLNKQRRQRDDALGRFDSSVSALGGSDEMRVTVEALTGRTERDLIKISQKGLVALQVKKLHEHRQYLRQKTEAKVEAERSGDKSSTSPSPSVSSSEESGSVTEQEPDGVLTLTEKVEWIKRLLACFFEVHQCRLSEQTIYGISEVDEYVATQGATGYVPEPELLRKQWATETQAVRRYAQRLDELVASKLAETSAAEADDEASALASMGTSAEDTDTTPELGSVLPIGEDRESSPSVSSSSSTSDDTESSTNSAASAFSPIPSAEDGTEPSTSSKDVNPKHWKGKMQKSYDDAEAHAKANRLKPKPGLTLTGLQVAWYPKFVAALDDLKRKLMTQSLGRDLSMNQMCLFLLESDVTAALTIQEILSEVTYVDPKDMSEAVFRVNRMYCASQMGVAFRREVRFKGNNLQLWEKLYTPDDMTIASSGVSHGFRKRVAQLSKRHQRTLAFAEGRDAWENWADSTSQKIGESLMNMFMSCATIPTSSGLHVRAFDIYTDQSATTQYKVRVLRATPPMIDVFCTASDRMVEMGEDARKCPMLVRPKFWTGVYSGGYLVSTTPFMRPSKGRPDPNLYFERGNFEEDYKELGVGMDSVQDCSWRMNKKVYGVMKAMWANGEEFGRLPPQKFPPLPPIPDGYPRRADYEDADEYREALQERREEFLAYQKAHQHRSEQLGLVADIKHKLRVAEQYVAAGKFYFPFFVDFRGRTYPVPPHLNHVGSDVPRGLLEFGDAKRVGPRGWHWMLVQMANLCGHDKVSNDERREWTWNQIDDILNSARDPLGKDGGKQWWKSSENPWQALQLCFAIEEAMSLRNPHDYMAHVSVHQDGSCNGLQHYAALGRDHSGGSTVNLVPFDKPQDVYSVVLKQVRETIERDSVVPDGQEPSDINIIAQNLKGKMNRKMIKRTVMTSVYGVTFVGARRQMYGQLMRAGVFDREDNARLFASSTYLAKICLGGLTETFQDATALMKWLQVAAGKIASKGYPVCWMTPMNYPVAQTYANDFSNPRQTEYKVNSRSNRGGFPPNFVHALDACHMFNTAVECRKRDVTFAAVHDSYWSHPSDVDDMSKHLREEFVRVHKSNCLEVLEVELHRRFPDVELEPMPERGSLDLDAVNESQYFFS